MQKEVRATEEEICISKVAGMRQQRAWMRLEGAMERRLTWSDIWQAEPQHLRFLIKAVYDVLPRPVNLQLWGRVDTLPAPSAM